MTYSLHVDKSGHVLLLTSHGPRWAVPTELRPEQSLPRPGEAGDEYPVSTRETEDQLFDQNKDDEPEDDGGGDGQRVLDKEVHVDRVASFLQHLVHDFHLERHETPQVILPLRIIINWIKKVIATDTCSTAEIIQQTFEQVPILKTGKRMTSNFFLTRHERFSSKKTVQLFNPSLRQLKPIPTAFWMLTLRFTWKSNKRKFQKGQTEKGKKPQQIPQTLATKTFWLNCWGDESSSRHTHLIKTIRLFTITNRTEGAPFAWNNEQKKDLRGKKPK